MRTVLLLLLTACSLLGQTQLWKRNPDGSISTKNNRPVSIGATVAKGSPVAGSSFPKVLYATWANTANNMVSTDGGTYNTIASTNGCPAGTCAATPINMGWTIPANTLKAGKILRITYSCLYTASAASPGIIHALRLGSTPVYASAATGVASNNANAGVAISFLIIGTADPGAAVVDVTPWMSLASITTGRNTVAPTTVATNTDLALSLILTWQGSTAGNMFQVRSMIVEELN